ncbi:O-acetylhomoserine (thiol)-lyase [Dysgonomonas sp. PFB1-18]|uniref:PLP-dependent transferase n=1 Tax=unclassified Dysgonomonas TaxID=2630389 RepID=UPI002476E4CE|nr:MULTISPECIES: PLP-dependent transferase [unclassified Dysgonomonas]MDH6307519.1 O-acetylhomoserine (thiol)-lyase [Dysgonomonas sp. PF1-14]MDH6337437.1 O-acetylhomoserine (thiol)-lyase [Dysgonomonas sp. PF1-16]MDH6379361.1 O-acetylhomoserine (thiol)-lyase [Dysgonomonas sp. PFB1-18]MDH6396001.1 O-acetylhomoserine (thiol)-lyase [Dysgonomonas sp. PF1-23]
MVQNDSPNEQFSTRVISEEFNKEDVHGAITMPVYRNAAFEFADSESIAAAFQYKEEVASHTYTRITNPTVENLERKIKTASGAENVMMVASGMAAISNTFLTLAYAGSNIVTSPHLFGNTFSLLKFTLAAFGVEVRFVNTDNIEEIAAAIDENTCAFFCELITNPHLEIADLPEISKLLRTRNVPMIVDTTIIAWCGFDARKAGVDIEVVSTTKYVSGGATGIGGAILDYGTFDWAYNKRLKTVNKTVGMSQFSFKLKREIARNMGAVLDPDSAYQQALGMETLQLRFEKMSVSAYELARFLSKENQIVKVGYTKLETSPYKKISDKLFTGNPGAMLTFNLESKEACYRFMDKLQIIRRATNLFDNKTLIIHPESTIYGTFAPEMKELMGIEDNLMRLSVGLEDVEDLKKDILQALM